MPLLRYFHALVLSFAAQNSDKAKLVLALMLSEFVCRKTVSRLSVNACSFTDVCPLHHNEQFIRKKKYKIETSHTSQVYGTIPDTQFSLLKIPENH